MKHGFTANRAAKVKRIEKLRLESNSLACPTSEAEAQFAFFKASSRLLSVGARSSLVSQMILGPVQ